MVYFIGFLIFILFCGANIYYHKREAGITVRRKYGEKMFLIVVTVLFFFMFAMQSETSNGDLIGYMNAYNRYKDYSISAFVQNFMDIKDPIYHLCGLIVSKIGLDFHAWRVIIGFFYCYSAYYLISRFSSNIYISLIVLITVGGFGFTFSGLRQTLAMAFLMFSFKYLVNKKIIKFVLWVVAAGLFHSTAVVFLLAYPLYCIGFRVRNLLIVTAGAVLLILFARPLLQFYINIMGQEDIYNNYLETESVLSLSGVVIFSFITLFCIIFIINGGKDAKYKELCNLAIFSVAFRILSATMLAELFRISMYFSIFDVLMIAEACTCDKYNTTQVRIKTLGATLAMSAYYFISPSAAFIYYVMR